MPPAAEAWPLEPVVIGLANAAFAVGVLVGLAALASASLLGATGPRLVASKLASVVVVLLAVVSSLGGLSLLLLAAGLFNRSETAHIAFLALVVAALVFGVALVFVSRKGVALPRAVKESAGVAETDSWPDRYAALESRVADLTVRDRRFRCAAEAAKACAIAWEVQSQRIIWQVGYEAAMRSATSCERGLPRLQISPVTSSHGIMPLSQ